jgi:hypothetical protein
MAAGVCENGALSLLRRTLTPAVLRELAVGTFFLLLSVVMTWPLVLSLQTYVSDPGDPWLNAWILDWGQRATLTRPSELFHAPIFHPADYTLAFSEHLWGIAVLTLPFRLLGLGPIAIHNIALLIGFASSGYGAWVLARIVTGSAAAALAAGTFYAFLPYRFDQLPHLQHVWSVWLPLLLAAAIHYARRPSYGRAALFGAAFLMNGLTNIHWFVFGSFSIVLTFFGIALAGGHLRSRRFWSPIAVSTLAASILLLPFLLPYRAASDLYKMKRGRGETQVYSATWSDWLRATPRTRLYGQLANAQDAPAERKLFPGLLALLLASAGVLRSRRNDFFGVENAAISGGEGEPRTSHPVRLLRLLDCLIVASAAFTYWGVAADRIEWRIGEIDLVRATGASVPAMLLLIFILVRLWIRYPGGSEGSLARTIRSSRLPLWMWIALFWVVLGVLGSLGMNAFFHTFLFQKIEIFRSVRAPARWAMVAYTGLAMLIAAGVTSLLRGRSERQRLLAGGLIVAALLLELRAAPILWYSSPSGSPPVYRWLAEQELRGAVLELPIGPDVWVEGPYLLGQTVHEKPIVNGFSGFQPPVHGRIVEMASSTPLDAALFDELERIGCSLIAVHLDRLGENRAATLGWLASGLRRGRIIFIGRFDHHTSGDWVFALPRVEPRAAAMRLPDVRDGAGRLPRENLEVMLGGGARFYSDTTFGQFDVLSNGQHVEGPLRLTGWALSPHGIAEVRMRLEGGRVVRPAQLVPRGDVAAAYPWYDVPSPGFDLTLDRRPAGVSRETYIQMEVVDGSGVVTRLDPLLVIWDQAAESAVDRAHRE